MGVRAYDLVLLDVDGTLIDLHRPGEIAPAVRETIRAVQAAGVAVSVATGRTLDYVRTQLTSLAITTPVVTTQGAVIGDPVTGRVLQETTIPLEQARALAAWADATHRQSAFYYIDENGHTLIRQNYAAGDEAFFSHVMGAPRQFVGPLSALLEGTDVHLPVKHMMFSVVDDEPNLTAELVAMFGDSLSIMRTHPYLVEVTAPGVDKGTGALHLCDLLGVDPQRVLAIGDHDNDIPMMRVVGKPIAMSNGSEGVKAVAHWVAPPLEEDGAAVALRRFVLDAAV